MGLLPVLLPPSTQGSSFYIELCIWTWWAHSKCTYTNIYSCLCIYTQKHTMTVASVISGCCSKSFPRELSKFQSGSGRVAQSTKDCFTKLSFWTNLDWVLLTLSLVCFIEVNFCRLAGEEDGNREPGESEMDGQGEKTRHAAVVPDEWDGPSKKILHITVLDSL